MEHITKTSKKRPARSLDTAPVYLKKDLPSDLELDHTRRAQRLAKSHGNVADAAPVTVWAIGTRVKRNFEAKANFPYIIVEVVSAFFFNHLLLV